MLHLIDVLGTEVPRGGARSTAEFEHVTPLFLKIPRLTGVTRDFSLICLSMDPFLFGARSFLSYSYSFSVFQLLGNKFLGYTTEFGPYRSYLPTISSTK